MEMAYTTTDQIHVVILQCGQHLNGHGARHVECLWFAVRAAEADGGDLLDWAAICEAINIVHTILWLQTTMTYIESSRL